MANAVQVTVTYNSKSNVSFAVRFHVVVTVVDPTSAPIPAIIDKINALTCGKPIQVELSIIAVTSATITSVVNYVDEDKAFMRFIDDGGNPHNYRIPGLDPSILAADKEEIPETGAVLDYTAAVLAVALTSDGHAISSFIKAYRKENRKKLKR